MTNAGNNNQRRQYGKGSTGLRGIVHGPCNQFLSGRVVILFITLPPQEQEKEED